MKKTYYIRYIGDSWHKPSVYNYNVDFGLDFGKFVIGKSNADLHEIIKKQLDDLELYDKIKYKTEELERNVKHLENHSKGLSEKIEELKENIDDLECEKSDVEDVVTELENDLDEVIKASENLQFEIDYRDNVTYE